MWIFGRILSSLNQVVVFDTTLHDVRFLNQQWLSYDVALCLQQAGRGQCLADRNTSSDRCTLRSCYFVSPLFHLYIENFTFPTKFGHLATIYSALDHAQQKADAKSEQPPLSRRAKKSSDENSLFLGHQQPLKSFWTMQSGTESGTIKSQHNMMRAIL